MVELWNNWIDKISKSFFKSMEEPFTATRKVKRICNAMLFAVCLGGIGAHKFYVGQPIQGICLFLLSIFCLIYKVQSIIIFVILVDIFLYFHIIIRELTKQLAKYEQQHNL